MKPLVGITCCNKPFGPHAMPNHAASDTYVRAVDEAVGAAPVLIPANGETADIASVLARLDGIVLTGSRSNVFPALYGGAAHPEGTPEDLRRDQVTMALIREAVARGLPILGICRGMQEMNVALGGTLHQQLRELPGRLDHRAPEGGDWAAKIAKSHEVAVEPGSVLAGIVGAEALAVNSLHEQGVDRLAPGLALEARAPDGTPEAVRVAGAPGFALGVQWHPEYDWERDEASHAIFAAFGEAVRAYAGRTAHRR
jgi:putative glutamine amidotransferase